MHDNNEPDTPARLPRLGIQLYTVRDLTGPAEFRATLATLAKLGFEGVEFAWCYGEMQPEQLADFLSAQGLACCGLHVRLDELLQPAHTVYRIAEKVGAAYITTSLSDRLNEWDALVPQLNLAGQIAADRGINFTYHNHWQEFDAPVNDSAFDRLVRETDPQLVGLELDLGWSHKAGLDAMELWRRLGRRIPQIHLRDYDRTAATVCDIADGFIDPPAVWRQALELGTEWLIYEQDHYPVSALESSRVCIARMLAGRP